MKKSSTIHFTELNVNRIQSLTDAVFAIVITILSLALVVPPGDTHFNHHHMIKTNIFSIWLNILFLMFVCLIPFSSGFLANYLNTTISVIIYSINLIMVSILHLAMLIYAWEKRFIDPHVDKNLYNNMRWRIILPTIVYVLIIPLAFLNKSWVVYLFLAPLFFQILFGRARKIGNEKL